MKLGQNIGFIDISDEFENGPDRRKNMAARGRGSFLYLAIEKPCKHNFCPLIMKVGQKIGLIDITAEFESGPDRRKNMAASGRGIFLYMYIVKTCEHSRSHIFGPICMKFGQNICFLDTWV